VRDFGVLGDGKKDNMEMVAAAFTGSNQDGPSAADGSSYWKLAARARQNVIA
jgi:hypothetical protein